MAKIVNISSSNKEEKLKEIASALKALKDTLVDVLDEYESDGESDQADTLTEALDALEDASDVLAEVLEG